MYIENANKLIIPSRVEAINIPVILFSGFLFNKEKKISVKTLIRYIVISRILALAIGNCSNNKNINNLIILSYLE
jgi:hypothetical protein